MYLNPIISYGVMTKAMALVLSLLVCLMLAGCENDEEVIIIDQPVSDGIIVAMGDSLTAGLGVPLDKSYPALLQNKLQEQGLNYRVINGGVSGETSSGARSRVDWILSMKPDLVILETGANDGLRGIEPGLIEKNIREIIKAFLDENITVVLTGMQMVANMGPEYLSAFNRMYPMLAAEFNLKFMPFFLEGVAMQPALNQADGIHPNEQGYKIIAENLLPHVEEAIAMRKEDSSNSDR